MRDEHWYALAIPVALAIDRLCGEPPARLHPVVGMGLYLRVVGARLARLGPAAALVAGAAAWTAGAIGVVVSAAWIQAWLLELPAWAAVLLLGLLLKPMLAWRMLRDEVAHVEAALRHSLPAARMRLQRIVSRDARNASETDVREAALESLAENLNDSVVAPLLWFALAGLPGAMLYRFANTADAMWGYRGRWEWAGKCAARADDALSWVPARLTALLLCAAALRWPGLPALRVQASRTPSPNGGWPMGTLALLLGCRLGKPGVYVLNPAGRSVTAADSKRALRWAGRAAMLSAGSAAALALTGPLRWTGLPW